MDQFPFTQSEWSRVSDAAFPLVNASLADDDVLYASLFIELQRVLAELRGRYGDHPVLLETEADFTDDNGQRICLYRRAIEVANCHRLPTLSTRLALARIFIDVGQHRVALSELTACEDEARLAPPDESAEWRELKAQSEEAH